MQLPTTHSPRAPRRRARTLGLVALVVAVQAAMVFAFVFPGNNPKPHHVPVGFVGSAQAEHQFATKSGDKLTVRGYGSERAARTAIRERRVYGALIATGSDQRLLVASAASMTVSQLLRGAAQSTGAPVHVQDVVPLDRHDPRGATINLLFLPLIVVCFTAVLALGSLQLRRRHMLAAVALFSLLGGVGITAVTSAGLDALPGPFLALSGTSALAVLAIALPTAGLYRVFGQAGVALSAVLFLVIGNPASGNGTAPELLPGFWRWISQLMPPGAGGTGIRNVSYFHGHALTSPLLVLVVYAAAGAALLVAADSIRRLTVRTGSHGPMDAERSEAPQTHAALRAA
jgi:hypothetical protein